MVNISIANSMWPIKAKRIHMKQLIASYSAMFLIASLLGGCAAPIFFETAQPSFKNPQSQFKNRFIGEYFDPIDSSGLIISEKSIRIDPYYFGESRLDTMFSISDKNVLKYYKKKYFLNYEFQEEDWGIHIIDLKKDKLTFYCFDIPEDIPYLKKFGTVKEVRNECGELVKIVLNPTKAGFSTLLKDENLESLVVYYKAGKAN